MTILLKENTTEQELIAERKRIIASMTREEQIEMMRRSSERASRRSYEEFKCQTMEHYKQSDRYKEYMRQQQAEQDNE